MKFGAELPVSGATVVLYDARTGVLPDKLPLVGVTPKEVLAVPIAELARESAGTERAKNSVVLGLIAGWFGIGPRGPARRDAEEARQEGRRGARGCGARLRGGRGLRRRASAARANAAGEARRPGRRPSCSPTATRSAPPRRSSPAATSSAATRSRPRPRSCSSSAARSGSTAAPCCRPRTRSPASAPRSAPRSPARRR